VFFVFARFGCALSIPGCTPLTTSALPVRDHDSAAHDDEDRPRDIRNFRAVDAKRLKEEEETEENDDRAEPPVVAAVADHPLLLSAHHLVVHVYLKF